MALYVIVDGSGNVKNTVMWDGASDLHLATGYNAVIVQNGYGVVNGKLAKLPAIANVSAASLPAIATNGVAPSYPNDAAAIADGRGVGFVYNNSFGLVQVQPVKQTS